MTVADWQADKMLDRYIHDYMVKNNLHKAAQTFTKEADISPQPIGIDSPGGFLFDWWSIFYETFAGEEARAKARHLREVEQQEQNHSELQHYYMYRQSVAKRPIGLDSENMSGQPAACLLTAKIYGEERLRHHSSRNLDPNLQLVDVNKLTHCKSVAKNPGYAKQQVHIQTQERAGNRQKISLGRSLPVEPTLHGVPKAMLSRSGFCEAGLNKGASPLPLNGWPLTGIEQIPPGLGQQGSGEIGGLAEISEKMGDITGDSDGSSNDNVESFLSHDIGNDDTRHVPFSTLQRSSTVRNTNTPKGFSFEKVGCLHASKSKVTCCHFSSDGKLLASAGHDKKVVLWDMDTFEFKSTSEGHSLLITDVRFRPNSTLLATSSFDKTVQVWDATNPSHSLYKLIGHTEQVLSLDFHPKKVDLLSSCDDNGEIRLWNVNQCACIRISKGGTTQVRFQPRDGQLLAAVSGNGVSVLDVETNHLQLTLQGHGKVVHSICWNTTGEYIASVSEDRVRVWSTVSGEYIHELCSNGNKFRSCTFHPGYSLLLVIGGYQSLELWNPTDTKTMTVPAHDGLISALANSPTTEMLASTSHDQCVKLWK